VGSVQGELVGQRVDMVVSDPWELTTPDGSNIFPASVRLAETFASGAVEERLLIELRTPVSWRGETYRYFSVSERNGHGLVDDLRRGRSVECRAIAVAGDGPPTAEMLDTSDWRGGLAANATVQTTVACR
jgi:hypothetical protein